MDLDGIPTLNSLKELYLAYNEISDISSCSLLENLTCLDLEGLVYTPVFCLNVELKNEQIKKKVSIFKGT
jgi:Leucine-rich repeat (LRR) protein